MRVNLKSIFGLAFFLLFNHFAACSQYIKGEENTPEKLLEESKALGEKATLALNNAALYQREGSLYLDSARFISNLIKNIPDKENAGLLINQFENNYILAYKFIAMADSMSIVAESFRSESVIKTKEAYAMMGKDVEIEYTHSDNVVQNAEVPKNTSTFTASNNESIPNNNHVSTNLNITKSPVSPPAANYEKKPASVLDESAFILQLGAGNMDINYFNKVPDIKIVKCKDGIKRYVLPYSFSKSDADKKKIELMKLGYEQIFIRTKASLDKISN